MSVLMSCFLCLSVFGLSSLLLYIYEKTRNKWFALFGLLLPCLWAGLRAQNVGTDVNVYVRPMYDAAIQSTSFNNYLQFPIPYGWSVKPIYQYEIAFTTVIYLIGKIFGNFQFVLFALQALVIVPIFRGLCKYKLHKRDFPISWGMFTFYMFFFNTSLNLMRQWIATAILIYAVHYLFKKQYVRYFIFVFIASLFHQTALLGIIVAFVFSLTVLSKHSAIRKIKIGRIRISANSISVLFIFIGIVSSLLAIELLTTLLGSIGLGKYATYLGIGFTFSANQLILRAPILIFLLLKWRTLKRNEDSYFWLSILMLDTVLSQIAKGSDYAYRIGMYFAAYNVFVYPHIFITSRRARIEKTVFFCVLIIYWMYTFVYKASDGTIPYSLFFQSSY